MLLCKLETWKKFHREVSNEIESTGQGGVEIEKYILKDSRSPKTELCIVRFIDNDVAVMRVLCKDLNV